MQTGPLILTYRCSSHAFLPSFSDVRVHAYSRRRTFKPIQRSLKIKGGKKSLEAGYEDKQIHHHACIINVHMPPFSGIANCFSREPDLMTSLSFRDAPIAHW